MATVEIKARHNGPYKVTGPVRLIDADGNEYDVGEQETIVLCRCGASKKSRSDRLGGVSTGDLVVTEVPGAAAGPEIRTRCDSELSRLSVQL